jgi:fimbrial isopeptide formation D2 family protein
VDNLPTPDPSKPSGATNWDAGLYQVTASDTHYDMVIFITDGAPTVWGPKGDGAGSSAYFQYVEQGIFSANAIKAKGTRIVGIGVGLGAGGGDGTSNLRAVSGPTQNSDYYAQSSSDFGNTLKQLASGSCTSQLTITKQLQDANGRLVTPTPEAANGIKFDNTISAGSTIDGTATTGTVNGANGQASAALSIPAGATPTITVTEGSVLGYTFVSAQCSVNGANVATTVNGTKASFTGTAGATHACTFINKPIPSATVNVHKLIKYSADATPQPINGWTVGATATATTGTVQQGPPGATQPTAGTDDQGKDKGVASWALTFGSASDAAKVAVSEQQQDNYKFDSGNALNQCKVTGSGAPSTPITISSQDGVNVPNVKPGQTVDCTFVNVYTNVPTKQVADPTDGVKLGSTVPWTIKAPVQPSKPGAITSFMISDKLDPRLTFKDLSVDGFTKDTDYTVAVDNATNTVTITFVTDQPGVGVKKLKAGDLVTVTLNTTVTSLGNGVIPNEALVFTNDGKGKPTTKPTTNWGPLEVCKQPAGDGSEPQDAGCDKGLAGAEFTVYSDSDATKVAGKFVTGDDGIGRIALFVGNNDDKGPKTYYLKETKAPAGYYVLDNNVKPVQIKAGAESTAETYYISNKQQTPPTLPLTGGLSTDAFIIGGGGLIVLSVATALIMRRRKAVHV